MHMIAKSHQDRIHLRRSKVRMNVEDDRLSSLPDDLIHKILSFFSIKHAIKTSVLSSRWKLIWTSMPYLNFSSENLFPKVVSNVLSRHNNQIRVSLSVKLGQVHHESIKTILNYIFSHNVQQLTVTCNIGYLISPFRSLFMKTPIWDLPTLTTLHLEYITLSNNYNDIFSKCTNLKNLSLNIFNMMETDVLNICHPRLSNLTLQNTNWWVKSFNVVAPQLMNLTIINCYGKHMISTPGLTSLVIKGDHPLQLFTKGFCPSRGSHYLSPYYTATLTWDLPTLTTLHLHHITLSDKCTSLFSKCSNLKNLSINRCKMMGTNVLNICHPRLSNLTLQHTEWWVGVIKVVAPKLNNLTMINCYGNHLISTTGLTSLVFKGDHPLQFSTQGFCSLMKADICIIDPLLEDVHKIVFLLQQLHSVKFLTLNLEIIKLLSSSMGVILHQPFAFANLKILKFSLINPIRVYLEVRAQEKVTTSTDIKSYQLDSSPSPIFTVVSCEEIRVLRDIVLARQLIAELRVGLEQCETLQQRTIEKELMTKMQHIDGLLTELPALKKDVIQATFLSVCEEADIVMNNMLDSMNIRCNKKRKRLIS